MPNNISGINKKRILVVCPSFPAPESGAEQMDRADGIRQLVRLGHEVAVLAKAVEWADKELIARTAHEMGARVILVPYRYSNRTLHARERFFKLLGKFANPLYLDGAAYEYAEPAIQAALAKELNEFKPHVVWFEYTYLWPLYKQVAKSGAKIVVRSANFEPEHFLDEHGRTLFNYIKYIPKYVSELISVRAADMLCAITPQEQSRYQRLGARAVVLPLRSLARFVASPHLVATKKVPVHVFYMGSSYKVEHNKAAAELVIRKIAPLVEKEAAGSFVFHILGGKLPTELQALCDGVHVVYEGYVHDIDTFLQGMDVALMPSLMGAGMQQKVFEPLVRGIPTITSRRAIAGYPYEPGTHFIEGTDASSFAAAIIALQDADKREALAEAASTLSAELFSRQSLDAIVESALSTL